jgi:autotransporter family porin
MKQQYRKIPVLNNLIEETDMKYSNPASFICHPSRLTKIATLVVLCLTRSNVVDAATIDPDTTTTVDGTGSLPEWSMTDPLYINGTLGIINGGSVVNTRTASNAYDYIGYSAGSIGTVEVIGAGSSWSNGNGIYVGYNGDGHLAISEGATVSNTGTTAYNYIANSAGTTGTVTITGAGSSWNGVGSLYVGAKGNGSFTLSEGATASGFGSTYIGYNSGSTGTAEFTGTGSDWNGSYLYVGYLGEGHLTISDGATASSTLSYIGNSAGSNGSVTVTGAGTGWKSTSTFSIGESGEGHLTISDGATITTSGGTIGNKVDSTGTVEVTGAGSGWSNNSGITVGSSGTGHLTISDGATVSSTASNNKNYIANAAGSTGTAVVTGRGSTWELSSLHVGSGGEGRLTVSDGAIVTSNSTGAVGYNIGSIGTAEVTGAGSGWNSSYIYVGHSGEGHLTVSNGATVSNSFSYIGHNAGSIGAVEVTGANSGWSSTSNLTVGFNGEGSLSINNGATVSTDSLDVGYSGKGSLAISNDALISTPRDVTVARNTGSVGELAVGALDGNAAVAAGNIDARKIIFGAGTGVLTLNHTSTDFELDAAISGSGTVNALSGISALTGNNSAFQGDVNIDSPATLLISAQNNIGTNDVTMTGGTLAIDTTQNWQFINALNGYGTLEVDTTGNQFDFVSASLTDNFSGVLALKDTLFSLAGTNMDALSNTLLKLGSGSVASAGDGQQTINGLAFDGGMLVMGSVTPGQTTAENSVHTTGQLDISGNGTVQVTTSGSVSNDAPVPDTSVPLLTQDDGNILVQLVSTEGSVTGSGGNLMLTDQNGSVISNGGVTAYLLQNGNTVAQGTWDYRLTGGGSHDGLYINYGLTQVELLGQGSDALLLNSEGRTGNAADLSAQLTGSGDLAIDTGTGNTVSLSNLENNYTGTTDLRSGTLLMQNDGVLGATSLLQMSQGTVLEMNGHHQTVGSVSIEDDAYVNLGGGHLEIAQGGSIAGELTGNGSLTLTDGVLTVVGANHTLDASIAVAQDATADLNDVQGLGSGAMALAGRVNLNGAEGVFINSLSGSGTLALSASQVQLASDNTGFNGTFGVDANSSLTVTAADQPGEATIENAGRVILSSDDSWQINNRITGAGSLVKYGSGWVTLAADSVAYTGATDIFGGALVFGEQGNIATLASSHVTVHDAGLLAGNGTIDGNVNNQGILQVGTPVKEGNSQTTAMNTLSATEQATLTINGDLVNKGLVRISGTGSDSQPGNHLTVNGDYVGENGHLAFSSVLGDDTSLTDRMTVNGDTSGTTYVSVSNAGGNGAQTLEGIEIIRVNGISDGDFVQSGRIVAGAYDYNLLRGNDQNADNWYLSSQTEESEPEEQLRPESGSYLANSRAANTLFMTRLDDRPGETRYTDALTGEQRVTSLWLRNVGGHTRSRDDSGQLKTQANRYVMQLGADLVQWNTNDTDRWHLGVMGGYARSQSRTVSDLTGYRSRGLVSGYSAGLYGTWYANDEDKTGLYVDTWALYNWFDNTVSGQEQATEKYKSSGVTASVETGYSIKLGESGRNSYWLQPQAQAVWMDIQADDHQEKNGTRVTDDGRGNLQTRLGMKAYISGHNAIDDGKDREFRSFVEANWLHNTRDARVRMDDVSNSLSGTKNAGEVKLGVEGQITPRFAVWGNVAQQVGDNGYSDTQGGLGVRYNW